MGNRRCAGFMRVGASSSLLAMLGVASLGGGGCSLLFAQGPGNYREVPELHCTDDKGLPAADTVLTVVGGAMTLFLLALSGLSDTGDKRPTVGLLSIPLVALPAGSALYGFITVDRCTSAKADLRAHPVSWPAAPVATAPVPPPRQPGAGERTGIVALASSTVRAAPYVVAPALARLPAGQAIIVSGPATNGWRPVVLPDGRRGYVQEGDVVVTDPPVAAPPNGN